MADSTDAVFLTVTWHTEVYFLSDYLQHNTRRLLKSTPISVGVNWTKILK